MICGKCNEQVLILTSSRIIVCGCGTKKASEEVLEYINERNY